MSTSTLDVLQSFKKTCILDWLARPHGGGGRSICCWAVFHNHSGMGLIVLEFAARAHQFLFASSSSVAPLLCSSKHSCISTQFGCLFETVNSLKRPKFAPRPIQGHSLTHGWHRVHVALIDTHATTTRSTCDIQVRKMTIGLTVKFWRHSLLNLWLGRQRYQFLHSWALFLELFSGHFKRRKLRGLFHTVRR